LLEFSSFISFELLIRNFRMLSRIRGWMHCGHLSSPSDIRREHYPLSATGAWVRCAADDVVSCALFA
jgi:hypothetical protein